MSEQINLDGYEEMEGSGGSFWKPTEPNEAIQGTVVAKDESGDYPPQWVIQTDEGVEITTPSHGMLQNKMEDVEIGEDVVIVFEGSRPVPGKESELMLYRVFRKKK